MVRADNGQGLGPIEVHRHLQELLPLAPVDGQNSVARQLVQRLPEIVVHAVHAVLVLGGLGNQAAPRHADHPQALAHRRVVGNPLRENVHGPLQGVRRGGHLLPHIVRRQRKRIGHVLLLGVKSVGQGLQAPRLGDRGAGFSLGPVRPVEIIDFGQGGGRVQGGRQLLGQRPLLLDDGSHLLSLLVQAAQIGQPFGQLPQHLVIQRAGNLLAVPGDKRDGIPVVNQLDGILHLARTQVKLCGKCS